MRTKREADARKATRLTPTAIRGGDSSSTVVSNTPGTPPAVSDAVQAARLFAEEVARLPGVLRIENWSEEDSGTPVFHVTLRPSDRQTEDAVYELKGQAYDHYPEACLEVVVLEAAEPFPADSGSCG